VNECQELVNQGYKEVTLLGQNVDSYKFTPEKEGELGTTPTPSKGGKFVSPPLEGVGGGSCNFAQLLEKVALIDPNLRVRFSTSHPKDITDDVLFTMAKYDNICKYIHLPVQSGNSRILDLMNRGYSREWYLGKVARIREIMPDCAISSDIITGFCSETEEDHQETLSLMEQVKFDYAFNFIYSERPNTPAAKRMTDDVPEEEKKRRLSEIIDVQIRHSKEKNIEEIGNVCKVLIESYSKRSENDFCGRNDGNKMVVFPKKEGLNFGDYCLVKITEASSATLKGEIVE
jgi:tRNA-2-methylthio-N6-dimethylallyladenosine synthase